MYHQAVLPENLDERVTTRHAAGRLEQRADDDIQLDASEARILLAVFLGLFHYQGLDRVLREVVFLVLVERLPAITKQPAENLQRCFWSVLA